MAKKKNKIFWTVVIFILLAVVISFTIFSVYLYYLSIPKAKHGFEITLYNEKMQKVDLLESSKTFSTVGGVENVAFFEINYYMQSEIPLNYRINVVEFPFNESIVETREQFIELPTSYRKSFGLIDANKIPTGSYNIEVEMVYKVFSVEKVSRIKYVLKIGSDKNFKLTPQEVDPIITEADVCIAGGGSYNAFGKNCLCGENRKWITLMSSCEDDLSDNMLILKSGVDDLSKYKLSNVNIGGVTYGVNDKFNNSIRFSGGSVDYGNMLTNFENKNFSIMFWAKPSMIKNTGIVVKEYLNETGYGVKEEGDRMVFFVNDGKNNGSVSIIIPTLEWHHYTAVRDGSFLKMYVDGGLSGQVPIKNVNVSTVGSLFIGKGYSGDYEGLLNNVRVYNQSLSLKQINTVYINENANKIW